MSTLSFALCGNAGPYDEYNPYYVTEETMRHRLLIELNRQPLTLKELATRLSAREDDIEEHIAALIRCGLVEEVVVEGVKKFKPSFTILLEDDVKTLRGIMTNISKDMFSIVKEEIEKVREVEHDLSCVKAGYYFRDLDYIVVVAYTLDYGALRVLSDEGYLVVAKEMPGGRRYVFSAIESSCVDLRKAWMWGHSERFGKYIFYTHGRLPPRPPRKALPDLAWWWSLTGVSMDIVNKMMIDMGRVLESLHLGRRNLEEMRQETGIDGEYLVVLVNNLYLMNYVDIKDNGVELKKPFLAREDVERIERLSEGLMHRIVKEVVERSWSLLKEAYSKTNPYRNGIALEEAFNFVYHLIFERCADRLIREGIISEPSTMIDGGKYSAWVAVEA
ncbi:MAG: hypothetical protein DRM97_03385 [Thermoprotei archaeon]|nr:MAG: hypothetical protein DRM97_03385 [Thermoprotei archaeon]